MLFHIGLQNNVEGRRSQAWVLGHPGCFAYGPDGETALAAAPSAIRAYDAWIRTKNGGESWLDLGELQTVLEETWTNYSIDEQFELVADGYEVDAWFRHDWKPLTEEDVDRGLLLLTWSRQDLLASVGALDASVLEQQYPGERWSITGILKHVAGAEWWYLDRLGLAFPREQVPLEPFKRLQAVRDHLFRVLPSLTGSRQVIGIDGEFWSPRKLLRRAAWHERDHTEHILKLVDGT